MLNIWLNLLSLKKHTCCTDKQSTKQSSWTVFRKAFKILAQYKKLIQIPARYRCFCHRGHRPVPKLTRSEICVIVVEWAEISIKFTKGIAISERILIYMKNQYTTKPLTLQWPQNSGKQKYCLKGKVFLKWFKKRSLLHQR